MENLSNSCIELLSEYGKMNVMLNCHKGFYKRHQTVMRWLKLHAVMLVIDLTHLRV